MVDIRNLLVKELQKLEDEEGLLRRLLNHVKSKKKFMYREVLEEEDIINLLKEAIKKADEIHMQISERGFVNEEDLNLLQAYVDRLNKKQHALSLLEHHTFDFDKTDSKILEHGTWFVTQIRRLNELLDDYRARPKK